MDKIFEYDYTFDFVIKLAQICGYLELSPTDKCTDTYFELQDNLWDDDAKIILNLEEETLSMISKKNHFSVAKKKLLEYFAKDMGLTFNIIEEDNKEKGSL